MVFREFWVCSHFDFETAVIESSSLSSSLSCMGVSPETPSSNLSTFDSRFSFFSLHFTPTFSCWTQIFSATPSTTLSPRPALPPLSPLSWRGHTQGGNESAQGCLQEAGFQRPSCITVTMEISATVMTHTHSANMADSWLLRQQNQWSRKNLYLRWLVTKQLCGVRADPRCLQGHRTSIWAIAFASEGHTKSTV